MRMPRFTLSRLMVVVGVLACAFTLVALMMKGPEEVGAAEAERDIAAGVLRLKTYGLPAHWFSDYQNLIKSRLGVEIKPVAGCLVTENLTKNVGGYNRRMNAGDRPGGSGPGLRTRSLRRHRTGPVR